jgi:16S rRNA (cytidine1402-2'-O)-methyltransferase
VLKENQGTLYVVSTPIGNLSDITYRAVEILKSVDFIAAEDTRHSKKILNHYNFQSTLISYHENNSSRQIPNILKKLNSGFNIALISDAGTPGISDPAYRLTREILKNNINIVPIPGPSALLAAIVASGLPTDRFLFEGFLPPKKGRNIRIEKIKNETATIIIFESPKRLSKTLKDLFQILGNRPAVVCRELTKLHEEFKRDTLQGLIDYYSKISPKGECVILVGKDDKNVYF